MGGVGIKKVQLGQKKKWTGAGPGECEPNRSGSSEPDRFSSIIYRPKTVFFVTFLVSFSLFSHF